METTGIEAPFCWLGMHCTGGASVEAERAWTYGCAATPTSARSAGSTGWELSNCSRSRSLPGTRDVRFLWEIPPLHL